MHSSYWYREYSHGYYASHPSYANPVEITSPGFKEGNVDAGVSIRRRVSYAKQTLGTHVYS